MIFVIIVINRIKKQANDAMYDELFARVKRLLTNHLHGKPAERQPTVCWCIMNGLIVYEPAL